MSRSTQLHPCGTRLTQLTRVIILRSSALKVENENRDTRKCSIKSIYLHGVIPAIRGLIPMI